MSPMHVQKPVLHASKSAPAMGFSPLILENIDSLVNDNQTWQALVTLGSTDAVERILTNTNLVDGMQMQRLSGLAAVPLAWQAELAQRRFVADQIVSNLIAYSERTTASLRQVRALDASVHVAVSDMFRPSSAPAKDKHDASKSALLDPGCVQKSRAQTTSLVPHSGAKIKVEQL